MGFVTTNPLLNDWAVIELDTPSTNLGWMSFGWDSTIPDDDSGNFNMIGFAGDKRSDYSWDGDSRHKAGDPMWSSFGPIDGEDEDSYPTHIDATFGNSGSPVYGYYADEDTRVVYGMMAMDIHQNAVRNSGLQ